MKKLKTKYSGVYKTKHSRDGRGVPYKKRKNRSKDSQRVKNAQDKLTKQLPNPALSHLARFESQIPSFIIGEP